MPVGLSHEFMEILSPICFKINPLSASVASVSLICTANQLTGFYMRATLALNGVKIKSL